VLAAAPVAPAVSASSYLCTGYAGCAAAGYGNAGYQQAASTSWWRMYGGHNCTNYVAYRMVQAGMSATRPFSGTGNAWNWGVQMASKTDNVPAVGAVAWFNKGVSGAGSVGHVAYVEQVVSPTEIIISEDSWSGDFHWRRITSTSGWPSGFIHLVDKALTNTAPVSISGNPAVGQTVTANPGGWNAGAAFTYQWWADGAPIAGATASTLKIGSELGGKSIVVRVTASLAGFSTATADSAVTPVALGSLAVSGTPALSGVKKTPMVGDVLTASQPTFSPAPRAVGVQWLADGVPISGATAWTYQLTGDTVLKNVTAVATAKRPGYAATPVASAPVGPVLAGRVAVQQAPAIKGPAAVGKKLYVSGGKATPAEATATYTWQRDGVAVPGATGSAYRVSDADAGAQMSVVVSMTQSGWLSRSTVLTREARVATKPTLTLKTSSKPGRALVWFRVEAPGAAKPSGTATVTVGSARRTVAVRKGVGRVSVTGLAAGKQAVAVSFRPTATVLAGSASATVRVKR
jgi:surface antigen